MMRSFAITFGAVGLVVVGILGLMPAAAPAATTMRAQIGARLHHGELEAVTCLSARNCTAVGAGVSGALAEHWNGSRWATEPAPPGPGTNHFLVAVSCTSASACTAVGDYAPKSRPKVVELTLADRWNGKRWTHEPTPNPAGTTLAQLLGVSCSSATACIAVGVYAIPGKPSLTLAERWNGKKWAIERTPVPKGLVTATLKSVWCRSATSCIAVGDNYVTTRGLAPNPAALAEVWDGKRWAIQPVPNPKGTDDSEFNGVSCLSATCTAVGQYVIGVDKARPLAEVWNGKAWAVEPAANPTGSALFQELDSVSCVRAKACTAVGHYQIGRVEVTLAEGWNGAKWAIEPTPKIRSGSALIGVSCKAPRCAAVGFQHSAAVGTLAEGWNGKKWAIEP